MELRAKVPPGGQGGWGVRAHFFSSLLKGGSGSLASRYDTIHRWCWVFIKKNLVVLCGGGGVEIDGNDKKDRQKVFWRAFGDLGKFA